MNLIRYILLMVALIVSATMKGQYNPTNPSEPGAYNTLTLKASPDGAGYFNINTTTTQTPGKSVRVRAYNYTNFTFVAWSLDGEIVSTDAQFDYTMPQRDVTLIAHYNYNPSNPSEPTPPIITQYSKIHLLANPSTGGSFNISSGNSYEVGSSVNLRAYTNGNFKFLDWTENGEVISTSANFNYVVKNEDSHLVANYQYDPSSPTEPSEARLQHTLYLKSNPSDGGYFNVTSGNKYEEGATVSLRAYNNTYYTFKNWTIGESVVSTNYQISYIMPTHDVTIQANYDYNYAPSNPTEPGQPDAHVAIYGMTEDAIRGQNINYPIHLENTKQDVKGIIVDVQFPTGFSVSTDGITLSSRAIGHSLDVVDLGSNSYRLFVQGTEAILDDNGKLLEIPVAVPDTAVMGQTYPVVLAHGVLIGMNDSQTPISVRSGGILIEKVSEDGLYARFSFDKYQNRVMFKNNSSDKAVRYEWDFGDGQTSTEKSPFHVYTQTGSYVVTLTSYGEYDKDVAEMNVLINESSNWTAQGAYNLCTDEKGVRNFNSIDDLLKMLSESAITGDLRIYVESGKTFAYDLTENNVQTLQNITAKLKSTGYTMYFEKNGNERNPEILFGKSISDYSASTIEQLIALGKCQNYNGVELKLWGVSFDMNHLQKEFTQTVCSNVRTEQEDFSLISRDLTFKWTLQNVPSGITGYETKGERQLPAMTIANETNGVYDFIYRVVGSYQGVDFYTFDYHVIVSPALIGLFGNLSPLDGALLETTDVTLTWDKIANATFDVYLWNAQNAAPTTPVATDIRELRYVLSNFCTNGNTYKWFVKAHNECQELTSDTLSFSIESLPNLHIYSLDCSEVVGDGTVKVQYMVKNDGLGSTGTTRWNDYIWLVPDVYDGTSGEGSKLLKTVENIKALAPGESYNASVEVKLPEHIYGNYFLLVATDMYNVTNIEWNAIGGSVIVPYNPTQDGSGYKHLYATTSSSYNKIYEQGETSTRSDNFFYKKIEIAVPDLADLQVTNITAKIIPGTDPIVSAGAPLKRANGGIVVTPPDESGDIFIGASDTELDYWSQSYVPSPVTAAGLRYSNGFYAGKLVNVKVTVENKGGNETKNSFRTVLYMSKSSDRDAAPLTAIASETCSKSFTSDKKLIISYAFYMPYDWSGDTYFHAYADIDDNVYELANTVNNWGVSDKYEFMLIPGADFKPSVLKVPANISVNTPFNISYTVKNIGAGVPFSNNWKDKVYLSKKDNGLDNSASCIATIEHAGKFTYVTNAAPGGGALLVKPEEFWYEGDNYTVSKAITLSNIESGKYYVYVKVDADDDVLEVGGEDDNVLCYGPVTCVAPDLEVELVSLSSDSVKTGETLALTWKVRNIGSGDIQNATLKDAFYSSINQDGANAVKIAEVINDVTIAAGQEKTLRANVTIPKNNSLNGIQYVFMKSNIDNNIKEISSANNQTAIQRMRFIYLTEPSAPVVKGTNVVVASIDAPESIQPGVDFSMSFIVKNQGENTVNKEVTYEAFISNSISFDPSKAIACEATVSQGSVKGLKTGAAVRIDMNVKIPSNTIGGIKYLHICVDRANVLGEKSFNDNHSYVTIKVEGNQPNLVIEDVVCPDTIKTSTATNVIFNYKNIGSWEAAASSIGLYLSKDAKYDSSDELLAIASANSLAVDAVASLKGSVSIADKNTGKWYVLLKADIYNKVVESKENDNVVAIPVQVIASPLPDLKPVSLTTDEVLTMGQSMTIKYTVMNSGQHATRQDRWSDTYYLATSSTLNIKNDIMLGSKAHVGKLEKDGSYTNEVKFTIPTNASGNYMLFVVTDASDAITEGDENNNLLSTPVYVNSQYDRPADLVVTNVSAPAKMMAGQNTTIEYTVSNTGEFTATGELSDAIYLSKDAKWDADDVMIGVVSGKETINPGASVTRRATGRITNITEGNYYMIVRTNSTRTISEQSTDNNMMVQKSPSMVKFEEIALDGSTNITTSGYYKLNVSSVSENKTIGFYLEHPENIQAGLYVSYEKVPTSAVYDNVSSATGATEQEVLVSKVKQGNYYILAQDNQAMINIESNKFYLDDMPEEKLTTMTLSPKVVNFGVTSFSIREGGTGGWISSDVRGALFDSIMDFRLQMDDKVILAESVTFKDQTSTHITFNLNDAKIGTYDVISELPDGTVSTLPKGFRVIPGASVGLGVKLDVPGVVRAGSYAPISVSYANGGTTDIEIYELLLVIDEGYLAYDIKDLEHHQSVLHIKPDFGADNRGYISIPPGTQKTLNLYMQQVANSSTITIYIVK